MDPSLYPFDLAFSETGGYARFPFMYDGGPVSLAGGAAAPSCLISARAAGNLRFNPPPDRHGPDPQDKTPAGQDPAGVHGPAREAFFRSLGAAPAAVYSLVQIHSRRVFALESPPAGGPAEFVREGDGIVSFFPGLFLALTVADCLPVFLLDLQRGFFAALHSGWKGTGIVLRALALLQERGTRPEETAAVLGPCIQSCCYRVDQERAAAFQAEFGASSPHVPRETPCPLGESAVYRSGPSCQEGWYLGLQAANARLLAGAGVRNIAYCRNCTFTDKRLGSYRREGALYTRMAAMAGPFSL
ncbi:MAG: polyphenol oxidase family protein [Spirochaetaceae bacterium]|jgi:YfiH family protein|nr:polyphenol oxidase family protein [Spirochaetaceae bacterium]